MGCAPIGTSQVSAFWFTTYDVTTLRLHGLRITDSGFQGFQFVSSRLVSDVCLRAFNGWGLAIWDLEIPKV